jgi:hypothetical protein
VSATIMLVFVGQGREVHLPVQQVEITPLGITTEDGQIAEVFLIPGQPALYRLIANHIAPYNHMFESVRVHRLMPSGRQLEEALAQFETDTLPGDEASVAKQCANCGGIGDHRCAARTPEGDLCGIARGNHSGMEHVYVRCLHASIPRH